MNSYISVLHALATQWDITQLSRARWIDLDFSSMSEDLLAPLLQLAREQGHRWPLGTQHGLILPPPDKSTGYTSSYWLQELLHHPEITHLDVRYSFFRWLVSARRQSIADASELSLRESVFSSALWSAWNMILKTARPPRPVAHPIIRRPVAVKLAPVASAEAKAPKAEVTGADRSPNDAPADTVISTPNIPPNRFFRSSRPWKLAKPASRVVELDWSLPELRAIASAARTLETRGKWAHITWASVQDPLHAPLVSSLLAVYGKHRLWQGRIELDTPLFPYSPTSYAGMTNKEIHRLFLLDRRLQVA